MLKNYQHILALAFAVKEINDNPKILPNITLGFHILNNYYTAQMTYKATLGLLSAPHMFVPNFRCGTKNVLIAVIGGLLSESSFNIATVVEVYKLPQVNCVRGGTVLDVIFRHVICTFIPNPLEKKPIQFLSVQLWNILTSPR